MDGRSFISETETAEAEALEQLRNDPNRSVVVPTQADLDRAEAIFRDIVDEWVSRDPHHAELQAELQTALQALR